MRILKISTNSGGGATTAANRQAIALRKAGHEVKHLYVRQDWQSKNVDIISEGDDIYITSPMPEFLKTDLIFQNYLENNRTDISNTYMSLWRTETTFDARLLEFIQQMRFDIVHCHWTSNLVSSRLLKKLKDFNVRVVVTGHDMNHFTGACHYDAGCNGFTTGCEACSHLKSDKFNLIGASMAEKFDSYTYVKPHYIFPSDWLNGAYRTSIIGKALGSESSTVIRNCIDTDFFSPAENAQKIVIRDSFGFDGEEILIVSGAENNHEIRKGFNYFENAFKALNRSLYGSALNKRVTFVAFGGGSHQLQPTHPNVSYRHLGTLKEEQVRDLFRVADLLAFTSIEENFANVILESLMCACPVLGFRVGGVPDIVIPNENGVLVDSIDENDFSTQLINIVLGGKLSRLHESVHEWRNKSFHRYSLENIAHELVELYTKTLEGEPTNA